MLHGHRQLVVRYRGYGSIRESCLRCTNCLVKSSNERDPRVQLLISPPGEMHPVRTARVKWEEGEGDGRYAAWSVILLNVGPYNRTMPKCHLDKKSLRTLYDEFSKEENLLSALMRKPEYVILVRLSEGLGQTSFENLIGMSKNLYKYESGKIKPSKKTAEKFLAYFKAIAPWGEVLRNFERLSSESCGWFAANSNTAKAQRARKKGAENQMGVRLPTGQEEEVACWLDEQNIRHMRNFKVGRAFVDFYMPSLKMGLECKRLSTKNRREHMKKVKEAALQGYKARFYEKNVRLAVVFESPLGLNATERQELCGPYDFVFGKVCDLKDIIRDQTA